MDGRRDGGRQRDDRVRASDGLDWSSWTSFTLTTGSNFVPVESGDYNGDGNSDILWRHDSGQVYIWEMNGLGIKAEGTVAHAPNDWHIQGVGDFDQMGRATFYGGTIMSRSTSGR
jgi:FG-GAP repeat